KLIFGLGLALFIFAVSAMVVVKNLDNIVANQRLINEQDLIIGKHSEMLFQMKGAQAELYRHQAEYTRNIDDLVNYIEEFDENMAFLSRQYSTHLNDIACMQCHSKIEERLTSLSGIFSEIKTHIKDYKEDVSILITTNDTSQIKSLENTATMKGNTIIGLLEKVRHAADKMRGEIKNKRNILIQRSRTIIFVTIFLTVAFSVLIFIAVIRGITAPVNSLIKGIQKIGAGDFSQRVDVHTKDEIGFMAEAFNNMTRQLNAMNKEKDGLLHALKEFNEELERKVKEATEELRLAQENMVRTETLAAVGTLSAGVSHEISTPLNTILGFTQLIISEMDDDNPAKGDLKVIEQETVRCKRIVQGLLDFARTPRHEEKLMDINGILDETLTLMEYQPSMKKIIVKKDMDSRLMQIEADHLQLKQVFLNIILNATQAMPEGGELKIATRNTGGGIEAFISDTGIGILEEDRKKIFQPFYTTKKDGTGLGLSISYGIIKKHGGEIYVERAAGGGTAFRIFLPSKAVRDNQGASLKTADEENRWHGY
ncbi:MAG: HAMP domain-containing protein, partial [Nitrospirae bacterium]|nr:HAMP domain-containing protein [Nitrospirota bacterium]